MSVDIPGAHNALVDVRTGRTTTWADLPAVDLPAPAAVVAPSSFDALAAVHAHARTGAEFLVVARGRMEQHLRAELLDAGFNVVEDGAVERAHQPRSAQDGRLWLLTSGSTGRPKRIGHTLGSLTTVSGEMAPRRWLCPYSPGTYAWWQVVTLGLTVPGQDVVFTDPARLEDWPRLALEHGVDAVSGTPTFWRQALTTAGDTLGQVPLRQVTLGGEPVDQAVLDRLRTTFPDARISWIYASSEVGASVVVHDGQAGFPVQWLDVERPGRPVLSVRDDELVVRSPHHGVGLDGEVRTGDRVEVRDGRVLIVGRLDGDEINVGGAKASAAAVRECLQAHPDVAWASVRGRKAPMVGTVVVADVVPSNGAADLEAALTTWSRARLPEHAVPRRFRFLDQIPAKETLKSDV